ncbi:hypothetical protein BC826DRAFT_1047747, partial [Russula brevipes]
TGNVHTPIKICAALTGRSSGSTRRSFLLVLFNHGFDNEGYSLWRVGFKYEELTQRFMSSIQIGGFFNRLEASHKHFFRSVSVLGTRNNSIITGALIARGQEIRPVVEVAPDREGYTYERIDPDNAEQKAFFKAALAWDLEVQLGTRSG